MMDHGQKIAAPPDTEPSVASVPPSTGVRSLEDAIAVGRALILLARRIRWRWYDFECVCCGASYHPRMGKPPKEATEDCGHAHFREAWNMWDEKADDWERDEENANEPNDEIYVHLVGSFY